MGGLMHTLINPPATYELPLTTGRDLVVDFQNQAADGTAIDWPNHATVTVVIEPRGAEPITAAATIEGNHAVCYISHTVADAVRGTPVWRCKATLPGGLGTTNPLNDVFVNGLVGRYDGDRPAGNAGPLVIPVSTETGAVVLVVPVSGPPGTGEGGGPILWEDIDDPPATFPPAAHTHTIADVTGLTPALTGKEPTITAGNTGQYWRGDKSFQTLNQDAVPDGTTNKAYTAAEKTKLAGIATGATQNDTDANLRNRANHTGTQTASTISDFTTAADARVAAGITGKEDTAHKGQPGGYAGLDNAGKVPVTQLPSSLMEYKGTWNASTNSPTLVDGTGDNGDLYRVSTAGSHNFGNGSITFGVGDYAIYDGARWQRSGTTDAVSSVAGKAGDVTLTTDDVPEGSRQYFTNGRAQAAAVQNAINNGITDVAPSQDAVYDALATKEPTISSGSSSQYYRGDKTMQTLNAAALTDFNSAADARVVAGITGKVDTTDGRLSDTRTPTDNSVTSAKIVDGAIVNADINASAAIAVTKLGITGTPNGSKYLRDDGTWNTPASSSATGGEGAALASESTNSGTYVDLTTTTDTVAVIVGASGLVLVTLYAYLTNASTGATSYVSFAASGANAISANDNRAIWCRPWTGGEQRAVGASFVLAGLTPGLTTFKMKYRADGGQNGTFNNRRIGAIAF
jgi:hypothetical protein